MNNKFIMHINYGEIGAKFGTYGRNTVDSICKMAAEIGYDGIEFRSAVPTDVDLSFEDYIEEIAKAKKKYGLSEIMFAIGIKECSNPDKEERQKSIERAGEIAKIVNDKCGTTICNTSGKAIKSPIASVPGSAYQFHGSAAATKEEWKLTVDSYQQFAKVIEPLGMKFAFETHMNYIHDSPAPARKLVDEIGSPNIGINMDFGNTVYFPTFPDLEETIDLYGDKLFYTHLKNSVKLAGAERNYPVALSDGMINHKIYFTKLKEIGFSGPVGIEAPRPGDRKWFAKQDFDYAKELYNNIF